MRPDRLKPEPAVYRVVLNLPRETAPGAGLPAYMLVKQLPGRSLITTRTRKSPFRRLPDNVTVKCHSYPEAEIGRSSGMRRMANKVIKAAGFVVFFLKSLPDMIHFRPDITHIHTPSPFLHGLFARYILRNPVCITLHGSEIRHLKKSRFWQWVLRRADHVFYVSHRMAGVLTSFMSEDKISYLPNGVNLDRFVPGEAEPGPVVAMVGNLRWQKDYPTALKAFQMFSHNFPSWELHIAGQGDLLEELKTLAHALGIADRVKFLGVLPRDQVALLLQEARVFLLSSVTEGFPKVILEAAAAGTPSIVTDVGDCAAIGRRSGFVVPPESPIEIAEALLRLAGSENLREQFSKKARAEALTYTWEARRDRVLNVYRSLLQTGEKAGLETPTVSGVRTPESTR